MPPINIPYAHRFVSNKRGRGLGGFLKSVGHVIRPFFSQTKALLKPIGKELSKQGISFLSNTAKDAINGAPLAQAFKTNFAKRKKRVLKKVKRKIGVRGGAKKKGSGRAKTGRGKATKGRGKGVKGRGKSKTGRGKVTKGKGKKRKVGIVKKRKVTFKRKPSIFDGYSL